MGGTRKDGVRRGNSIPEDFGKGIMVWNGTWELIDKYADRFKLRKKEFVDKAVKSFINHITGERL